MALTDADRPIAFALGEVYRIHDAPVALGCCCRWACSGALRWLTDNGRRLFPSLCAAEVPLTDCAGRAIAGFRIDCERIGSEGGGIAVLLVSLVGG